jgi:adenine/guanine phosphoribosyltransferase-like PRPP-binding protein
MIMQDDDSSFAIKPKKDKFTSYQLRIFSVELLRSLKSFATYRELSSIFDIDPSSLSRYLSGSVLPSEEKAENIISKSLDKKILFKLISKINQESFNVINPEFFHFFSFYLVHSLLPLNFNKVVCFANKDAFFGYSLALLTKAKLVLAYNERYFFPDKRVEYTYTIKSSSTGAEIKKSVAIPKNSIKHNDSVIIIGKELDVPEDYLALMTLVKRARSDSKIVALAFIQIENKRLQKELETKLNKTFGIPIISIL